MAGQGGEGQSRVEYTRVRRGRAGWSIAGQGGEWQGRVEYSSARRGRAG